MCLFSRSPLITPSYWLHGWATSKRGQVSFLRKIHSCATNTSLRTAASLFWTVHANSSVKYRKRLFFNAMPLLEWTSTPPTPELMLPEDCSSSHARNKRREKRNELAKQRTKEKSAAAKRKHILIRKRLAKSIRLVGSRRWDLLPNGEAQRTWFRVVRCSYQIPDKKTRVPEAERPAL